MKLFCDACLSFHLLDNPSAGHNPVPLDIQERGSAIPTESEEMPCDEQSLPPATSRTHNSRSRETLERELVRLNNYRTSALEQLQQIRNQWIEEIMRATAEIEEILTEKCDMMAREIAQCLGELDDCPSPLVTHSLKDITRHSDSMLDLSFDLRPIDLNTLIKQFINFSLNYSSLSTDNAFLYKFFGSQGCVSCFDTRTERVVNTFHVTEKFLHNSAWVLTPNGEIYATGGSLMGKSKDDVILFLPTTEETRILSPMRTPRRSHTSVFLQNSLYVFGGIYEEQNIALAESLDCADKLWRKVRDMTTPRAYLGSAVFKEVIYLAGGADTSSIDIYHPDSDTYSLAQIDGVLLTEACALLNVDDTSLLIFHGNYQGEVLSYRPDSQELVRLCEMCHGNSWSNCAPVKWKDAIYTLRSDSVFKFDIATYTSSYVVRLAKSTKKRKCCDDSSPLCILPAI